MVNEAWQNATQRRQRLHRAAKKDGRKDAKNLKSSKQRRIPFHRLPREIIAEIFILCIPNDFMSTKSKSVAPILLCNVSPPWRSLALSIPCLWNRLAIEIIKLQMDVDFSVAMTESWLERSGELPLRLSLGMDGLGEKEQSMAKALLNTFCCYADRWESVNLSFFLGISFPDELGPTPLLRRFFYATDMSDWAPCPLISSPLLSSFSWPFSCAPSSNPGIPWHQLTDITLGRGEQNVSTHQVIDILRSCKGLVKFEVDVDDVPNVDILAQNPIENRSLRYFRIATYHGCSDLFQSLILPSLTNLAILGYFFGLAPTAARPVCTQLLGLFTRSKCKIEKLTLENCKFSDPGILRCLKHDSCSSLTALNVSVDSGYAMFTDRVILALANNDGLSNDLLLPHLTFLSLSLCVWASSGLLGYMIAGRCLRGYKNLKTFRLVGFPDHLDIGFLTVAQQMGLDLHIVFNPTIEFEFAQDSSDIDD